MDSFGVGCRRRNEREVVGERVVSFDDPFEFSQLLRCLCLLCYDFLVDFLQGIDGIVTTLRSDVLVQCSFGQCPGC